MVFTSKQLTSHTLGSLLKKSREDKGLSLKDIEKSTGIVKKYLEYVEADDFYKFPSATYTRGVLSRYGEALGLNSDDIVNAWKREHKSDVASSPRQIDSRSQKRFASLSHLYKYGLRVNIKMAVVIIILALILFYIGVNIKSEITPPIIAIAHPPDEFITNEATLMVKGITEPYSEVFINNQLIGTADKEGKFFQEIALVNGLNTIEISAKKKYSGTRTIYRRVINNQPQ